MARATVTGAREASRALRALSRKITPATVRRAHTAALTPMVGDAQANFTANGSYKTGVIPRDIVIAHTEPLESVIGLKGRGAQLGHLIEFGTAPHYQPMRRQMHPGAAAKPFLRPAFESGSQIAIAAAGGVYARELTQVAALLRR